MSADKPLGMYFNHKPDIRSFAEDVKLPLSNKYIGIEIEAENIPYRLDDISSKLMYWNLVADGSLRNYGAEFITRKIRGKDIGQALDELKEVLEKYSIVPEYTDRTSVHIHVDSRYMLFSQLKTTILLYLIYEPLLFTFVGNRREDNNYCVPYYRNTKGLQNLSAFFSSKGADTDVVYGTVSGSNRYEAMNIRSLERHGSIEFRHHYGTHDKVKLLPWIQALLYIFRQAKAVTSEEVMSQFNSTKYSDFIGGINQYLRVESDLEPLEKLANYSVGSVVAYSISPGSRENPF